MVKITRIIQPDKKIDYFRELIKGNDLRISK